jgi:cytochrome c oxidase assembly factor CtaG
VSGGWTFAAAAAAGVLYAAGLQRYNRRHPARPFPLARAAAFGAGVACAAVALGPPLDPLSAWLLTAHMSQHLLLMLVAAPLILLGTPLTIARQSGVRAVEWTAGRLAHNRALHAAVFPPVAWGVFAAVLAGSHFSPLYEAALDHPAIHMAEHTLYLGAALLFWYPVVGLDPSPWRMGYGLRVLYVAAALPVQSLVGLAIYSAGRPLYAHYAIAAAVRGTSVLSDQENGGIVMWLGGGLPVIVAILCLAAAWAAEDRRRADQLERASRSSRMSPTQAPAPPSAPAAISHHP